MSRFSATAASEAIVPADRMAIWVAVTDPDLLVELTPLLRRIDTDGDLWTWHLARMSALGVGVTPQFTERMRFDDGRRIEYSHEPPVGATERTAAEGWYDLSDTDAGTRLEISMTLRLDLPLPRAAAPAVTRIMRATVARTGDKFTANLLEHLGVGADEMMKVNA